MPFGLKHIITSLQQHNKASTQDNAVQHKRFKTLEQNDKSFESSKVKSDSGMIKRAFESERRVRNHSRH